MLKIKIKKVLIKVLKVLVEHSVFYIFISFNYFMYNSKNLTSRRNQTPAL